VKAFVMALVGRDAGVWLLAARPLTLPLAVTPVLLGAMLAGSSGAPPDWLLLCVTLLAAVAIQIGTNLHNDVEDCEQGNDTLERRGPQRATASGWLEASQVRLAAQGAFALAAVAGLYLIHAGGWPILLLGVLSLLAGYAYSGGLGPLLSRPLSHTPLGELFVFVFFGLAAVVGTYYLQTGAISRSALLVGAAMGGFAAAVLHVNNSRDVREDREAGRKTLAIMIGGRAWLLYLAFLLLPFIMLAFGDEGQPGRLPLLALPYGLYLAHRFTNARTGMDYNRLLVATIGLQLLFASLLAASLFVA